MNAIRWFLVNIWDLIKKEYLFDRFDETTGLQLMSEMPGASGHSPNKYRGLTLWLKEIIESILAIVMIVYFLIKIVPFITHLNFAGFPEAAHDLLIFSGSVLIADSLLLIAALISSPGIDETIDSISVSLSGIFLLILGSWSKIFEKRELLSIMQDKNTPSNYFDILYKVLLPIAITIILLVFSKHFLRILNNNLLMKKQVGLGNGANSGNSASNGNDKKENHS